MCSSQCSIPVADPGFPVGGVNLLGGHQPLTWVLFGENVCEKERIWSCRGVGGRAAGTPPRSANVYHFIHLGKSHLDIL